MKKLVAFRPRATIMMAILGLGLAMGLPAAVKSQVKVIVIMDTIDTWSTGIRDGFLETLDRQLAAVGSRATYQFFDTKLDPATIPAIQRAIDTTQPDLICTINYPTVFADTMVTMKPANARYNFVTENCIPLESGLFKDVRRPGGNVTGVGVFTQMNSLIKLAKLINPRVTKMAVNSWAAMTQVNQWFEAEFRRAAKEDGVELVEFRRVNSIEEELAFYSEYEKKGDEYFVTDGIGTFVRKDGTPVSAKDEAFAYRNNIRRLLYLQYDEDSVKSTGIAVAGTSVIWYDIGAQMAEKGFLILNGTKPGDIPWDYPRKFNIIINKSVADRMGYALPPNLLGAAYRVYTDLEGNFVGQRN